MAKVKPLRDRVLVQRIEEAEQKVGGIIIPDTAKEKPQQAEVVAVGSGRVLRQRQAHAARPSRRATRCSSASGRAPRSRSTARSYLILKEDEILGIVG